MLTGISPPLSTLLFEIECLIEGLSEPKRPQSSSGPLDLSFRDLPVFVLLNTGVADVSCHAKVFECWGAELRLPCFHGRKIT